MVEEETVIAENFIGLVDFYLIIRQEQDKNKNGNNDLIKSNRNKVGRLIC